MILKMTLRREDKEGENEKGVRQILRIVGGRVAWWLNPVALATVLVTQ